MGVLNKKFKSFTLLELIIAIGVIGVLMMATTVYLGGTDEKRRVIEAQGCAYTLGGEISNFVFYALTSKNLTLADDSQVSPDYYYISLTGGASNGCNGKYCKILLSYSTGSNSMKTYKSLSDCHGNRSNLVYSRTGGIANNSRVIMNKGFSISSDDPSKNQVFEIQGGNYTGDIIISLCINDDCSTPKEISKYYVDGRSQTISTRNCKFYEVNDGTKCKEREK